jgi:hypothetical protein
MTVPISQEIKTTVMIDPFSSGVSIPVGQRAGGCGNPIDTSIPSQSSVPSPFQQSVPLDSLCLSIL